ncbi:MAG: hypothetical protein CBD76_00875 [Pelagibacteraceae bacterium TMED216]|nr:MAG: hypothetical protein CBD76_00875 [Pelagibacteraceae bacterium TMED216]
MKKVLSSIIIFILLITCFSILFLSTIGIETKRFNNLISNKISKIDNNLKIDLSKIKIKIDIKNLSFFIQTKNPEFLYNQTRFQLREIRAYVEIKKIFRNINTPNRIFISSNLMEIGDLKQILIFTKPSNFKSFVINNIASGELKSSIELNFDDNFNIKDYQIDGYVNKINGNYKKDIEFNNLDFIFAINENSGSLKDIKGLINQISLNSGILNYKSEKNLDVSMKFKSKLNLDNEKINQLFSRYNIYNFTKNQLFLEGKSTHDLKFVLDKTLKLLSYDYFLNLENSKINLKFEKDLELPFFDEKIKNLSFSDSSLKLKLNSNKKNEIIAQGAYHFNEEKLSNKFNISNNFSNINSRVNAEVELSNSINIPFLNYIKPKDKISKLNLNFLFKKKIIQITNLKYTENNNKIHLSNFILDDGKINNLGRIVVKTSENKTNYVNNDFTFSKENKIFIKGKNFDARNLINTFNKKGNYENRLFDKISDKIEINFDKINTKNTGELLKFKLIGDLKNGKFEKIVSKGEFKKGGFLDISLKKNQKSGNKFLEIYSDFSSPLLADYDFFKGLEGGTLLFNSVFDDNESQSNLIIENFKVKNAPNFVKLLALADFGGLEDLVSGSGLSFDKLDISFTKEKKILKLEELYAIGPSISILMEGYVDENTKITSLRGTMVPAKNLNKLLSKIPVVGKIIIPDEIGEGLFGVSFKMKGPPGKIKTTVNPIKTLTPRFIQKAIDKQKFN